MDLVPKNFSSLDKDVIENGSGTHSLPVLVGIALGEKGKGVVFIIKIEDKYFFMYKKHAGAKWLTLKIGKSYEMFFEAAFKIGRIRPSKRG